VRRGKREEGSEKREARRGKREKGKRGKKVSIYLIG